MVQRKGSEFGYAWNGRHALAIFLRLLLISAACLPLFSRPAAANPIGSQNCVPILLYHRFGSIAKGEMTVTMASFEEQLHILREDGFHIIPLADLVSMLGKPEAILPSRSVVITSDDGHESVYQEMFPIILKNNIPMTLFIYPSAISNANYAMTWAQLREMRATGLVDIQSHTYWHPNFAVERRRLSTDAYRRFVTDQLLRSKRVLEQKLGSQVNLLAWPFGIYDADLIGIAKASGYIAAMTIERRPVTIPADPMTLPRYIVMNNDTGTRFRRLLSCPR